MPVSPVCQSLGETASSQLLSPAWSTVLKEGACKPQKPLKVVVQLKPGGAQARFKQEQKKMGITGG